MSIYDKGEPIWSLRDKNGLIVHGIDSLEVGDSGTVALKNTKGNYIWNSFDNIFFEHKN